MLNFPVELNGHVVMSQDVYDQYRSGRNGRDSKGAIIYIIQNTGCSVREAKDVLNDIVRMANNQDNPPPLREKPEFTSVKNYSPSYRDEVYCSTSYRDEVHCPNCGSTAITAGPRGANFTWGLIGASKTVNRCANCGYTWKPRG